MYKSTSSNKLMSALANEYASRGQWFVTLTYRSDINRVDRVRKDIRTMSKYMRDKAYGKHAAKHYTSSNHVMMVGGIERHADNRIHMHLMLSAPPPDAIRAESHTNLVKYTNIFLIDYWERVKKHSYQNESELMLTKSDSQGQLRYCLKYTSENNPNFFICHWDNPECVLPAACLR